MRANDQALTMANLSLFYFHVRQSNLSIAKKMRENMSGQKSPFFEKEQGAHCHVPTRSVTNLLLFSHSAFEQRRFQANHTGSNVKKNCKMFPRNNF